MFYEHILLFEDFWPLFVPLQVNQHFVIIFQTNDADSQIHGWNIHFTNKADFSPISKNNMIKITFYLRWDTNYAVDDWALPQVNNILQDMYKIDWTRDWVPHNFITTKNCDQPPPPPPCQYFFEIVYNFNCKTSAREHNPRLVRRL